MAGAVALATALGAVAVMGFAIQRGGTCTVAAVDEFLAARRFTRFAALIEAALWVGGGMAILSALGLLTTIPESHAVGIATVAGGMLLGLGAYINRACVFGSIARLGSGEWAYLLTPAGFYIGCLATAMLPPPARDSAPSPLLAITPMAALLAGGLIVLRSTLHGRRLLAGRGAYLWSPHSATLVIGLSFLAALLAAGPWTYTEAIAEAAHGRTTMPLLAAILFLALLAGAIAGGWSAGLPRAAAPTPATMARCLVGGVLMGMGSTLIPGGNDGIILVGLPLLQPYAWVAFAAMCATIAGSMMLVKLVRLQ